jgi:hypothetical protein
MKIISGFKKLTTKFKVGGPVEAINNNNSIHLSLHLANKLINDRVESSNRGKMLVLDIERCQESRFA